MLEKLAKLLGCEAKEEAVVEAVEKLHAAHGSAVAAHQSAAKAHESAAAAHVQALDRIGAALGCEAKPEAIEAAAKALAEAKPVPGAGEPVELSREGKLLASAYADKLAALVKDGALNAATAAALKPLILDDAVKLARDGELETVGKILTALAGNGTRVATGGKTGAQIPPGSKEVKLSREDQDQADSRKAKSDGLKAEIQKRTARK